MSRLFTSASAGDCETPLRHYRGAPSKEQPYRLLHITPVASVRFNALPHQPTERVPSHRNARPNGPEHPTSTVIKEALSQQGKWPGPDYCLHIWYYSFHTWRKSYYIDDQEEEMVAAFNTNWVFYDIISQQLWNAYIFSHAESKLLQIIWFQKTFSTKYLVRKKKCRPRCWLVFS